MTETTTTAAPSRWYPQVPPGLPGESDAAYTDRLTGADGTGRVPYDHKRNRQCSIGWHNECSDPAGRSCECPCHVERNEADARVAAWNAEHPPGTRVVFPEYAGESPTVTTGPAVVSASGWPAVELQGFPNLVWLSWLAAEGDATEATR